MSDEQLFAGKLSGEWAHGRNDDESNNVVYMSTGHRDWLESAILEKDRRIAELEEANTQQTIMLYNVDDKYHDQIASLEAKIARAIEYLENCPVKSYQPDVALKTIQILEAKNE